MPGARKQPPKANRPYRRRRFEKASGLVQTQIRKVSETRGFAVSRLLTHWYEIVGADIAKIAVPVKIGYSRGSLGATLTILTTGAHAPMLQAQLPKIQERANACYGYRAIAKIHITQTAPTGFSEGQINFTPAPPEEPRPPDAKITRAAEQATVCISDAPLRQALAALGANILNKAK